MKKLTFDRFSLRDTIESGQTFTWTREGNGYVNSDLGQVIYVEQVGNELHYDSSAHSVDLNTLFRQRLTQSVKRIHRLLNSILRIMKF